MNYDIIDLIVCFLAGIGAGLGIAVIVLNIARIKVMELSLKRKYPKSYNADYIANTQSAFDKFDTPDASAKEN